MHHSIQHVASNIQLIRGFPVLLDFDLAAWYEVETRVLKQTVRRNMDRFPDDFMFVLSEKEIKDLVSQNVIPNKGVLGGATPFAFTQEGVAMLSGLLRSPKAIAVNIGIMRAFVAMRQHALNYKTLATALKTLENNTNHRFAEVSKVLDALLEQKQQQEEMNKRKRIGYK